jgi:ATP-binding cassette subfamily F protein uup
MKILNREQGLDDGRIIYELDLVVARLQQDPPRNVTGTVYDFVAEGIAEQAAYLKGYHDVSQLVMTDPSDKNLNELARLGQLDNLGLWQLDSRINEVLEQLNLDLPSFPHCPAAGCVKRPRPRAGQRAARAAAR